MSSVLQLLNEGAETEAERDSETHYSRVANRMREDIALGVLAPEQWLKVRVLSERYGVSAAPIREALQVLQGEGLIVMEHNRGARVRRIDAQRLIDIFDVREAIESYLTAAFAESASPHQVTILGAVQAQHDQAVTEKDYHTAFEINRKFHQIINSAARNYEALEVIERHLALTRALRLSCGFSDVRQRTVQQEHHQLLDAFRRHDSGAARQIAAMHVRSSKDDLLSRLPNKLRISL
jgi:DNA-binding GntR family transcriptional regulator